MVRQAHQPLYGRSEMSKIHFLALVAPEFDSDMLEHWTEYYISCKFDDYFVFLHSPIDSEGSDDLLHFTKRKLARYGISTSIVKGEFNTGALRAECFRMMMRDFDKDDTVVTADSDEIHGIDPSLYRGLIEQYDLLEGALVDRWGGTTASPTLAKALPDISLELQYPHKGNLEGSLLPGFFAQPTKILASRCRIEVDFTGSHNTVDIYNHLPLPRIAGIYEVAHYRWRESILLRMALRGYYTVEHMLDVCNYFNVPVKDRREFMLKQVRINDLRELEKLATRPLAPVPEGMKNFTIDAETITSPHIPMHRPALFTEGR